MVDLPKELLALRAQAKEERDPTCADETLSYLLELCARKAPEKILEIGAAEGLTACALLLASPGTDYVGIESDPMRARRAREHFARFSLGGRATLHEGDAGEILPLLNGAFDLIFLDGPKAQYLRYLPDCKRLLKEGGTLLSDDVLLFGWVRGEPPKKRRMLIEHIREYLKALQDDEELSTQILELGEGLAVTEKRSKAHFKRQQNV